MFLGKDDLVSDEKNTSNTCEMFDHIDEQILSHSNGETSGTEFYCFIIFRRYIPKQCINNFFI